MFKEIKNYEKLYLVSDTGDIFSLSKIGSGGHTGKYLKLRIDKDGYLLVNLRKNKKSTTFKVHRLVAEHYLENLNNYPCVNHKDFNKQNNTVGNLEWCSVKQNNRHTWNSGKGKNPLHVRGADNPNALIDEQTAKEIIYLRNQKIKLKDLSAKFNLSISQICGICKGTTWKNLEPYRKTLKNENIIEFNGPLG